MTEAGESIFQGLKEALEFAKGNQTGAIVHKIEIPTVDVSRVRAKTALSQAEFSRMIGVEKRTLENWEQGRRNPTGPARVLLALVDKDPAIVPRILDVR